MAPHSSTLAWKIPWTEKPGRLQSMGSQRVGHDWATTFIFNFHALEKEMATHSSVLAWRIPGAGEPGGLPSVGPHRVGHDWSDLAPAAAIYHNINTQLSKMKFILCVLILLSSQYWKLFQTKELFIKFRACGVGNLDIWNKEIYLNSSLRRWTD